MTDTGIVGVGAAVIMNRQVVWMKGYGFGEPLNVYTRKHLFTQLKGVCRVVAEVNL